MPEDDSPPVRFPPSLQVLKLSFHLKIRDTSPYAKRAYIDVSVASGAHPATRL